MIESTRGFNAERTSHGEVYDHYVIFQDVTPFSSFQPRKGRCINLTHLVLPRDMLDSA